AFLIKENHIVACGGIDKAVALARRIHPDKPVEAEVENLIEFQRALAAQCDIIMLDELDSEERSIALSLDRKLSKIEVSGGIIKNNLETLAKDKVNYASSGALTKHVKAVDLSMRLQAH